MQKGKQDIILALSSAVLLVFASVCAYTISTESTTNSLTIGNVDIILTEDQWQDKQVIVPDAELDKNPVISNAGKNETYVFAKVTVPCVVGVAVDYSDNADGHYQGQQMPIDSNPVPLFKFGVTNKVDGEDITTYDTTKTNTQLVHDEWALVDGYPKMDEENLTLVYVYAYAEKMTDLTKPEGYYYSLKKLELSDDPETTDSDETKTTPLFDKIKVINFTNKFVSGERSINVDAYGIQSEFLKNLTETDIKDIWQLLVSDMGGGGDN